MVFHFVFEEAQEMITRCNHLMQQSDDPTEYHHELKIRWKQAFSMLRMARDLAFVMDDEDNYEVEAKDENTDEDTDEEMPDLLSESGSEDEAQDAEMSEAQDTSEQEVESTKQRAEGGGC
jgi:hypothetical protein